MPATPNVRMSIANDLESVAVIRQALAGLGASLGLDALEANDIDTAVTETCNNVVHHAYDGLEGPLELEVHVLDGALEVVVRDRGIGIRPHVGERSQPHTGLGMPIVHALTQRLTFSKLEGGGTEVRMLFATPHALAPQSPAGGELQGHHIDEAALASTVALSLAPGSVVKAVLPHALGALAQRAELSGGQIAEVRALAETLAAHAAGRLNVTATLAPGALELRAGPLRAGATASLQDSVAAGLAARIELCDDGSQLDPEGGSETCALRVLARG